MKWRPAMIGALCVVMVAAFAAQVWVMVRQQDLRERRQVEHQEAVARWQALPRGPGQIPPPMPVYYQPPAPPPVFLWQAPLFIALAVGAYHEQKKRKELEAEEETRTTYAEEDLMADWEFKIVRSPVGLFDRPAFLERILTEEAAGGWKLVEKFDKHRVRLKRPGGSMPSSATWPAGYDPFRTVVGPQTYIHPVLWVLCVCCALAAVGMAVLILSDPQSRVVVNAGIVGTVAVIGALVFAWLAVRMRGKYRAQVG